MLTDLHAANFRCFNSLSAKLSRGFNFFVGANGEGKTSILEAICVLLRLQSQRTSTLMPLIRAGAKSFTVRGSFSGHLIEFQYGGLRRKLRFDGVEQRTATEYLRVARVVSFANADIDIVRGSSEGRRRYLDFVGTQIDERYRPTLRAYERALRARNALLKSTPVRPRELAAYDPPLIAHGTILRGLRASIVERLAPFVAAAHRQTSKNQERVDIYFSPGHGEDFAADLARSGQEEIRLKQTIVGPHRDEVDLFIDGMSAQVFASEGQQRTLAVALKIAQANVLRQEGAPPILLIDDIFGELDPGRRNALLASLPPDTQKLVTATTLQWRQTADESAMFELKRHQILPIPG
jgi:DNA replication and repair protein RecF